MKLSFWSVGKPHESYIREGVTEFTKRIKKYFPAEWNIIPVPKNAGMLSEMDLKRKEGETILQWMKSPDFLVALDVNGKQFSSDQLSVFLQQKANQGVKRLVFLVGGAFGLDEPILKMAGLRMSLSALTFPHQLVRLILAEQIYRACTIMHHEKYHHR